MAAGSNEVDLARLHHICHAVAELVREYLVGVGVPTGSFTVTVVGSTAVLPWLKDIGRDPIWNSKDVDFLDTEVGGHERSAITDATNLVGEGSPFFEQHKVYAECLPFEVFAAPSDWPDRALDYENPHQGSEPRGHRIRVPAPIDLVTAKLVRGDEVDWAFARMCVRNFDFTWEHIVWSLERVAIEREFADPDCLSRTKHAIETIYALFLHD